MTDLDPGARETTRAYVEALMTLVAPCVWLGCGAPEEAGDLAESGLCHKHRVLERRYVEDDRIHSRLAGV